MINQREEFEETAARMGYSLKMRNQSSEDGEYGDRETQCAWDVWQECCDKAREQGAEPVAEIIAIGGREKKWVSHAWLNVSSLDVGDKLYTQPQSAGVPEAFILRKQAEAVEEVNRLLTRMSEDPDSRLLESSLVMQYAASEAGDEAQRLRQQAGELEAGGRA